MKRLTLLCLTVALISGQIASLQKVTIDRKTETRLSTLFEHKPRKIELFLAEDGGYVVEAGYENSKLVRKISEGEYRELLAVKVERYAILESARVPHLIGQSFLGLSAYSWSLPIAIFGTSTDNGTGPAAVGLLTPFAYTTAQFLLTRNFNVTNGAAYGAFLGAIQGAVRGGIGFGSVRMVFPASIAENLIDFSLGQTTGVTPAVFHRKLNHSAYGYYHYLAATSLISGSLDFDDADARLATVASLLEGYASLFLSRRSDYLSWGDALFEMRASEIGGQTLPLILLSADLHGGGQTSIDERIYAATSLAGFGAGYWIGWKLSQANDLAAPAGVFTYLLPDLAHGLTAGLGVLITGEDGSDSWYWRSYPAIFSTLDIGMTYFVYRAFARPQLKNPAPENGGLNFHFNPAPLLCKHDGVRRMPILGLSCGF